MGIRDAARNLVDRAVGSASRVMSRALGAVGGGAPMMQQTSSRERALTELERLYWGEQYEGKNLSAPWDKQPPTGPRTPLRLQKPSVQYDLPRVIVDRPTALLFGEGKFPEMSFEPRTAGVDVAEVNAWLAHIADEGALPNVALTWSRQGGALGSAVLTWSIVEGEFCFEAHKSIHCRPTFHKRRRDRLERLEKRYKFKRTVEEMQAGAAVLVERDFWHREEWTPEAHIVYVDVLAPADGSEPTWTIDDEAVHGLGFVPGVWVKNLDDGEPSSIDGVSLLHGLGDIVEDIDRTLSQKSRAVRYNQEPEKVYTGLPMDPATQRPIAVGGGASTSLPKDGDAKLLEMKGDGQRVAEEHVVAQRGRTLEVARVVVPNPETMLAASKSGAALRILFAPTLELVGELRQSYGRALREVLRQILRAAREGKLTALGALESPPPAELPDGHVKLVWGAFIDPTPDDLKAIAEVALALKDVLDDETILRFLASYFGIKDVNHVLEKLAEQGARGSAEDGEASATRANDAADAAGEPPLATDEVNAQE